MGPRSNAIVSAKCLWRRCPNKCALQRTFYSRPKTNYVAIRVEHIGRLYLADGGLYSRGVLCYICTMHVNPMGIVELAALPGIGM